MTLFTRRSRSEQEEAQRMLYEMFYRKVYRTAFFVTRDRDAAEDIVQETFIKAFKHLDKVEDVEKTGAWLATIATRTAIDAYRRSSRHVSPSFLEEVASAAGPGVASGAAPSAEEEALERWNQEALWDEVEASLDCVSNSILVLKYIYGLKDQEIADRLELAVGTVKSRVHRAKLKLRSRFEERGEPHEPTIG